MGVNPGCILFFHVRAIFLLFLAVYSGSAFPHLQCVLHPGQYSAFCGAVSLFPGWNQFMQGPIEGPLLTPRYNIDVMFEGA